MSVCVQCRAWGAPHPSSLQMPCCRSPLVRGQAASVLALLVLRAEALRRCKRLDHSMGLSRHQHTDIQETAGHSVSKMRSAQQMAGTLPCSNCHGRVVAPVLRACGSQRSWRGVVHARAQQQGGQEHRQPLEQRHRAAEEHAAEAQTEHRCERWAMASQASTSQQTPLESASTRLMSFAAAAMLAAPAAFGELPVARPLHHRANRASQQEQQGGAGAGADGATCLCAPTGGLPPAATQPLFVAQALGVLTAIVAVHEAGHFAAARLQVMRVLHQLLHGPPAAHSPAWRPDA